MTSTIRYKKCGVYDKMLKHLLPIIKIKCSRKYQPFCKILFLKKGKTIF